MDTFEYDAPAEVYSSDGTIARKRPVTYRRFARSAEAIRFTIEQLPQAMQRGTVMEVGGDRIRFTDIRALYDSKHYPLSRRPREQTTAPLVDCRTSYWRGVDDEAAPAGPQETENADAELPERKSQLRCHATVHSLLGERWRHGDLVLP